MKFLRNPWIVGLLGLGAVVVVIFNTFHPHGPLMPVPASGRSSAGVVVNAPPEMPGSGASPSAANPTPTVNIDADFVKAHLLDWLSVTQRDPFFLAKATALIATNAPVRQANKIKLRAIWRQDGVAMAAIDGGIFRLGDDVEGRKLERIDHNGIWLESNGKRDFVIFDDIDSASATNSP